MLPPTASWLCLLGLLLHILPCAAARTWGYDGWVRPYRCDGHSWLNITNSPPFWVSVLTGKLENLGGSTQLSVAILGVYNTSLLSCDELDLTALERSLRFKQLGHSVGKVSQFNTTCPLPITPELTPRRELERFVLFNMTYELDQPHKLQTLVAEYEFQTQSEQELECVAAKITPYIGSAYSYAFTLMPAGVMALVGAASWHSHAAELGHDQFLDYSAALFSPHGLIWETVLDVSVYLRYLQFMYLSSSVSIEYPGFLPPIVSNLAWSTLLFWRGAYDGGFSYPGPQEGMYVSNSTYGMDHMSHMLGSPRIMDIVFDAFLNLVILIGALCLILGVLYLLVSKRGVKKAWQSGSRVVGAMSAGVCLTLFSMPLIAFMSNDLMLIGYLPNYRVTLIGLTISILVFIHYLVTRPSSRSISQGPYSSNDPSPKTRPLIDFGNAARSLSQYLPHFIPLLQALIVGALQEYEIVQIMTLPVSEGVYILHAALSQDVRFRFSRTITLLLAGFRLIVFLLLIVITYTTGEAARQTVGYVILCLHGIVVIPGFVANSIWRLYRTFRKRSYGDGVTSLHSDDGNGEQGIRLGDLDNPYNTRSLHNARLYDIKRPYEVPHGNRTTTNQSSPFESYAARQHRSHAVAGPSAGRSTRKDYSSHGYYRKPRAPRTSYGIEPSHSLHSQSSGSSSSDMKTSPSTPELNEPYPPPTEFSMGSHSYGLDALSQIPNRPQVDYSFREADLFYGIPVDEDDVMQEMHDEPITGYTPGPIEIESQTESQTQTRLRLPKFSTNWAKKLPSLVQPKPKEKGFQVVRPGNAALRMARMQQAQRLRSEGGETSKDNSSSARTSEGGSSITDERSSP